MKIIEFLKGVLIGIGKVTPILSGSLIAININEYDKLLFLTGNFLNLKKNEYIYFLKLVSGILIGIILFSFVINYIISVLNNYFSFIFIIIYIITNYKYIFMRKNIKFLIFSFLFFILIKNLHFNVNFQNNYFLIGLIEGVTMIIPAVSGTAILLSLGLYKSIINIYCFKVEIINLILYFSGVLFIIYIFSKLILKVKTKNQKIFDNFISLLIYISIISIVYDLLN